MSQYFYGIGRVQWWCIFFGKVTFIGTDICIESKQNDVLNTLCSIMICELSKINHVGHGNSLFRYSISQEICTRFFALLCFVVVIHWVIFPYPSGLLHWHCGNLTIAPVPAKQPWWIWINTSCEFIMNDCITTTKQSTTKPCAYFLGYTAGYDNQGLKEITISAGIMHPLLSLLFNSMSHVKKAVHQICHTKKIF